MSVYDEWVEEVSSRYNEAEEWNLKDFFHAEKVFKVEVRTPLEAVLLTGFFKEHRMNLAFARPKETYIVLKICSLYAALEESEWFGKG